MFFSNYSSQRLSFFLWKSIVIPLVVKTCWYAWLMIMASSVLVNSDERADVLSGVGLGLIFTQLIYQMFAKGLVHKFDVVNKQYSI